MNINNAPITEKCVGLALQNGDFKVFRNLIEWLKVQESVSEDLSHEEDEFLLQGKEVQELQIDSVSSNIIDIVANSSEQTRGGSNEDEVKDEPENLLKIWSTTNNQFAKQSDEIEKVKDWENWVFNQNIYFFTRRANEDSKLGTYLKKLYEEKYGIKFNRELNMHDSQKINEVEELKNATNLFELHTLDNDFLGNVKIDINLNLTKAFEAMVISNKNIWENLRKNEVEQIIDILSLDTADTRIVSQILVKFDQGIPYNYSNDATLKIEKIVAQKMFDEEIERFPIWKELMKGTGRNISSLDIIENDVLKNFLQELSSTTNPSIDEVYQRYTIVDEYVGSTRIVN